jgi:hypothetical protein
MIDEGYHRISEIGMGVTRASADGSAAAGDALNRLSHQTVGNASEAVRV